MDIEIAAREQHAASHVVSRGPRHNCKVCTYYKKVHKNLRS